MRHRHLTHEAFTLAAIDDVIDRGRWADWSELRAAALASPALLRDIERVCAAHVLDPYAQRYRFWERYAQAHLA